MALVEDMAKLSRDFVEAWDTRTTAVAGIRVDTAGELHGYHEAREAMAAAQDAQLKEGFADLRHDMAITLSDLDKAHAALAAAQDAELKEGFAELRRNVGALLGDLERARQAMAVEQRAQLAEDRGRLAAEVAANRKELLDDFAGAHAAWAAFNATMAKRRQGAVATAEPLATRSAPADTTPAEVPAGESFSVEQPRVSPESAQPIVDDLTPIRGVGSGMQERLNELGIHSFAQLAQADANELRQRLGDTARLARIESWIEQAEELSKSD